MSLTIVAVYDKQKISGENLLKIPVWMPLFPPRPKGDIGSRTAAQPAHQDRLRHTPSCFTRCGIQVIIDRTVFGVAPLPLKAVKFGANGTSNNVPDYSFLAESNLIGRLA